MQSKVKTFLILTVMAVVILSALGLARYFNVHLGIASGDSSKLTLTVPGLTNHSTHLSARAYHFDINNICLAGFLFIATSWRALLIRHIRS
jgi:hypothetical protein